MASRADQPSRSAKGSQRVCVCVRVESTIPLLYSDRPLNETQSWRDSAVLGFRRVASLKGGVRCLIRSGIRERADSERKERDQQAPGGKRGQHRRGDGDTWRPAHKSTVLSDSPRYVCCESPRVRTMQVSRTRPMRRMCLSPATESPRVRTMQPCACSIAHHRPFATMLSMYQGGVTTCVRVCASGVNNPFTL